MAPPSPPSPTCRLRETEVRWLRGGVWVRWRDHGFVVDAPPGITLALGGDLPAVRAVILTGGRWQSVGGLVELLCRLGPHRSGVPMDLRLPLGEERGPALAETWVRAWGAPYPLALDLIRPGGEQQLGPMRVEMQPMRAGEPTGDRTSIVARVQVGVRLTTPDAVIAWVPGAAPAEAVRRLCTDADLAVVEAGVEPWPAHDGRWRMTPTEASERGAGARRLWLVGDDGAVLDGALPEA